MRKSLWIAVLVAACGSEEAEVPVAAIEQPGVASIVADDYEPEHGGTVVAAGQHPVEVVAHRSGQVYAHVLGDAPRPDRITVNVPVRGGDGPRAVSLRYNRRARRYEGRVRGVEIVEGPVGVIVVAGGVEYVGHVDVIVIAPAIVVVEHRGKHKFKGKHRGRGRVIVAH